MDENASRAREAMRAKVYGETVNSGLLNLFEPRGRVLDVGCGTGAWVPALRAKGAVEMIGIEFATEAADQAALVYDRLVREPVENVELADLGGGAFDTIIVADVIEHLVDPWRELRRWAGWVVPGGQLVISVPNLRHFRVLVALARGRFTYADEGGVMDRTHLRWFTRQALTSDLQAAGWDPVRWGAPDGRRSRRIDRASVGYLGDFLVPQLRVLAVEAR